ncbi:DNA polymerase III subunit alpha [Chitinophaga pinensis]|uniref:DNA-directed DNA polymerase n=1 Tax=Chitinophaga pinensis (strain ATCC 43595 / DSM 2588 / LMG 13176 / NBRC 15968 / NCIMB 11800 / UQM 2034) TaxID=485918 RepID=A0A979GC41_CHIPD|nr:DNA polymerase III subunit alpha [Chitinophaga pinensis]ACU64273.1 DNA polymerase III, alpha subunit [Chitinophaga pinensis DSM 2588]
MYLNCKTFFSLRYGTIDTKELVKTARQMGITSLALTNINITSDTWNFVKECQDNGIKPIIGLECRNNHDLKYILLARNMEGWFYINRFLSDHLHKDLPFPDRAPAFPGVFAIYTWNTVPLQDLYEHELVGIRKRDINKLFRVDTLCCQDKLVILHPVTFQNADYYHLHRILRAVDQNILISQLQDHTAAHTDEMFISPGDLFDSFEQYPHIISNTVRVMDACQISFDFKSPRNKKYFTTSEAEDHALLRKLAYEGMLERYGPDNTEAKERIEKELDVVQGQHFNGYFLITWDIIRYAQERGFFYVGRGSGANSIIAYCLKITDVDPIELNLYFERFLNPYRSSPPDFDIDFSWKDRDEIIAYVFKKYGTAHTALLGTVTTFQQNATIRELGKVYGLPKQEIDKILDTPFNPDLSGDSVQQKILRYSQLMSNDNKAFPNHLSIHAGGILISEAPIHQHCSTYLPPKGFSTAQLDMHQAEAIGLFKFDILSQRGLGHIRDAISIIRENKGDDIDIHNVKAFMRDERVKHALQTVNTIGCFYIESPAMRQLLLKLECHDYLTLVAASSVIRPGVAQSGMMRQYVHNYRHQDQVVYLHEIVKEVLSETFGIMVYQEDVIKIVSRYANMDLADADILRRAMAGKYRGQGDFQKIEQQFFNNCKKLGRPDAVTAELWRQIASFSGFSFSKAHSASFAVESYQSLYLKTYYPAEFMVAVINNFGGFYNRELYFRELQKTGVTIKPPCINNSDYYTRINDDIVYTGFIHVEGLEVKWMERVLEERGQYGPYASLEDFATRIAPPPEQLDILIRIGAFSFDTYTKKELLWKSSLLLKAKSPHAEHIQPLFREELPDCQLPMLAYTAHENAFEEIALLGFPLCSPFTILQHDQSRYITANNFRQYTGQTINALGYLVCTKGIHTSKGIPMSFGTFMDANGDFIDTVHFPDILRKYPFQKGGFYMLQGKVTEEYGVFSIEIGYMRKIGYFEDK